MAGDVIIVGAGIAGLYAGMKLAQAGIGVCILDRRNRIGLPVRCGEATGNRAELSRFVTIDEAWIARDLGGMSIHPGSGEPFVFPIPDMGVVLHRDRFEQMLALRAQEYGAKVVLDTLVTGLVAGSDGTIEGVRCDTAGTIPGSLIIGADGCESKVGRWAGITGPVPVHDAYSSVQYRVRSTFCNDNTLHFFIGASVIEKGYAWVFPKSASEISVGAGVYRGNCEREKIAATLHRFLDTRMPGAQRSHFISGCIPLSICPRVPGKGRVLCIGDAARQVNPLTAGGIMNALEAADLVVQAIARHGLSRPDAVLRNYAGAWTRSQRRQQKLFYLLKEVFLESSDSALLKLLRRIPRSAGRVDRSKPFTFPLVPLARLALMWMPGFVRHAGVLFR